MIIAGALSSQATDGDATDPNNRVTYPTIALAGDPTGSHPFELDSGTGAVSVSGLDHETSRNFLLTITAQDGGVPFESAVATLNVTVLVSHPPHGHHLLFARLTPHSLPLRSQ